MPFARRLYRPIQSLGGFLRPTATHRRFHLPSRSANFPVGTFVYYIPSMDERHIQCPKPKGVGEVDKVTQVASQGERAECCGGVGCPRADLFRSAPLARY
eukprot:scaffold50_cov107-Isochrysis_galbana.AAC.2